MQQKIVFDSKEHRLFLVGKDKVVKEFPTTNNWNKKLFCSKNKNEKLKEEIAEKIPHNILLILYVEEFRFRVPENNVYCYVITAKN